MSVEIWKPVVGYEGFYEVSNMGRVRSLPRQTVHGLRGGSSIRTVNGVMTPQECSTKNRAKGWQTYLTVKLGRGVKGQKTCLIHRIVAEAFLPNPEHKREVNHLNGDKHDNRVENLEWVSSSDNHRHSRNILHKESLRPVRCVETGEVFESIKQAKAWLGKGDIRGALSKNKKDNVSYHTAGGYHWEYVL